ncbi:alkyl/aryl-sulfatase [Neobacillus sp. SAB-20_R2A]|uniref:alkyl/aryl-sulfatase n=1 Tax=Neobacillus sp. SAB-20_R2A TaxID=3120519 RepID=UPI003C6DE1AC
MACQSECGFLSTGIGSVFGTGNAHIGFEMPNVEVKNEVETLEVDGIHFTFLLTPHTEAPAEMHFYIEEYKALFVSENANKTLHQIYAIRGAKTRDSLEWVKALDRTIDLFGEKEIDALVMIHAWPVWGKERAIEHLKYQRDLYKYIHDQTVRLANHGYTMDEIAELIELPESLGQYWGNRGYYGTLKHNSKAVYNFYLGYYSGHPSDLDPLTQVEAGKKYVQYMGGAANILKQAKVDFENGEYRWVAQVVRHVVMADPENVEAKELLADAFEQLGYQAESANWRNAYLLGTSELRNGVRQGRAASKEISRLILRTSFDEFFKLMAVRLNGPKAEGKRIVVNVTLTDVNELYTIYLENSVLNKKERLDANPDVSIVADKKTFFEFLLGAIDLEQTIASEKLRLSGNTDKLKELLNLLDDFNHTINIVTP